MRDAKRNDGHSSGRRRIIKGSILEESRMLFHDHFRVEGGQAIDTSHPDRDKAG